jgi:hypothetical protein
MQHTITQGIYSFDLKPFISRKCFYFLSFVKNSAVWFTGADPGFQDRGVHLKKLRRAEGGAKTIGVFRVKNHDFTPKNHILYPSIISFDI